MPGRLVPHGGGCLEPGVRFLQAGMQPVHGPRFLHGVQGWLVPHARGQVRRDLPGWLLPAAGLGGPRGSVSALCGELHQVQLVGPVPGVQGLEVPHALQVVRRGLPRWLLQRRLRRRGTNVHGVPRELQPLRWRWGLHRVQEFHLPHGRPSVRERMPLRLLPRGLPRRGPHLPPLRPKLPSMPLRDGVPAVQEQHLPDAEAGLRRDLPWGLLRPGRAAHGQHL
mmetsp:Transcript_108427/g.258746  ORF Transcript_108427/g.258746 Transcript_108427/m.258746 type:complete len:223 (-) Transcript_108427:273-941(-)